MSKVLTVSASVLALSTAGLLGVGALSIANRKTESPTPVPTVVASATATPSLETFIKVSNTSSAVKGESGLIQVIGEIENTYSKPLYAVSLVATFYAKDGTIVGIARGVVNKLGANEKRTFTLLTSDFIPTYATLKVQPDTILE